MKIHDLKIFLALYFIVSRLSRNLPNLLCPKLSAVRQGNFEMLLIKFISTALNGVLIDAHGQIPFRVSVFERCWKFV